MRLKLKSLRVAGALAAVILVYPAAAQAVPPLARSRELHFKQLDKNKDGRVSREEYLAPWPWRHRYIGEQQFREFDKNKDGYLTPEEYIPGRKSTPQK
jgi:hypothetical protein